MNPAADSEPNRQPHQLPGQAAPDATQNPGPDALPVPQRSGGSSGMAIGAPRPTEPRASEA